MRPMQAPPRGGGEPANPRARSVVAGVALALVCLLPLVRYALEGPAPSLGWDESMHAALPAARMVLSVEAGDPGAAARAALDCTRYPFVYPVVLGLVQGLTGVSESAARWTTVALWCLTLAGTFLLAGEVARRLPAATLERFPRAAAGAPWIAVLAASLCPLAQRYAGTLFLEVPSACAATFALRAWVRCGEGLAAGPRARRELAAGAWLTAAFFTKFNYGGLLVGALAADRAVEGALAWRRGRLPVLLARSVWLVPVPALVGAWWFLLPWPGGPEHAALHRAALVDFLSGNLEMAPTPAALRALYWGGAFVPAPAFLVVLALGVLASARWLGSPAVRALWAVLVLACVPVWLHPFHLDRFLVPEGPPTWCLAAVGLATLPLPTRLRNRAGALLAAALLAVATLAFPTERLARSVGLEARSPEVRAWQRELFADWRWGRGVASQGLARDEADALFDLAAGALGPTERVGWLGLSSEVSPAALHLALLARGGSPARFLADAHRPLDVVATVPGAPLPDWGLDVFRRFAEHYDALLATDPTDLKDRAARRGTYDRFRAMLEDDLGWRRTELGTIDVMRGAGAPLAVHLRIYRAP